MCCLCNKIIELECAHFSFYPSLSPLLRSETLSVIPRLLTLFHRPLDHPLIVILLSGQFSSPQMAVIFEACEIDEFYSVDTFCGFLLPSG